MLRNSVHLLAYYFNAFTLSGSAWYAALLSGHASLLMLELYLPEYMGSRLNAAYVFYLALLYNATTLFVVSVDECLHRTCSKNPTPALLLQNQTGTMLLLGASVWLGDISRLVCVSRFHGDGIYAIAPYCVAVLAAVVLSRLMHNSGLLSVRMVVPYRVRTVWLLIMATLTIGAIYYRIELEWYEIALIVAWCVSELITDLTNRQLEQADNIISPMPSCLCISAPGPAPIEIPISNSSTNAATTTSSSTLTSRSPAAPSMNTTDSLIASRNDTGAGSRWMRRVNIYATVRARQFYVTICGAFASVLAIFLIDVDKRDTLVGMFVDGQSAGGIIILMLTLRAFVAIATIQVNQRVAFAVRPSTDGVWRALIATLALYVLLQVHIDVVGVVILFLFCILMCAYAGLSLIDFMQTSQMDIQTLTATLVS